MYWYFGCITILKLKIIFDLTELTFLFFNKTGPKLAENREGLFVVQAIDF